MHLRSFVAITTTLLLAACTAGPTVEGPRRQGEVATGDVDDNNGSQQGPGTPIPEDPSASTPAVPEGTNPPSTPETPAATPSESVKKVLDVKWFGQETFYWCGPGSTRMAIGARLAEPPTQTQLANVMGTTENGTDHIGLPAKALNQYLKPETAYRSVTISDPPTDAQREGLKKDILARIGAGFPIVANVVSGWRPPEYPGGTIYHYVTVVGFDESGAKVLIADPAAEGKGGGARWTNVPRTYWVSLENLATWIGSKGYTG